MLTINDVSGNGMGVAIAGYNPPPGQPTPVDSRGAVGNGRTNDTAAFRNAFAGLGTGGGTVSLTSGKRYLIDDSLVVPPNCEIMGTHTLLGSPKDNYSAPYLAVGGALVINPSKPITLMGGAGITKCLIYRKGMAFPELDWHTFGGLAVQAGGDDTYFTHNQIMGFNLGYLCSGFQRPRVFDNYWDNRNNIEITQCLDVPYVARNHAWPFGTISSLGGFETLTRPGIHINIHDTVDWAKLTDNFSFGYYRSVVVNNANSTTITSCSGDNLPQYTNAFAIEVSGSAQDTRVLFVQGGAQSGVRVATWANFYTKIIGGDIWGGGSHGVLIDGPGDVGIFNNTFRGVGNGVTVNDATATVTIDSNRFQDILGVPVNMNVSSTKVLLRGNNDFGNYYGISPLGGTGSMASPTVATAGSLTIPSRGELFYLSGTTAVGSINGFWTGRIVSIIGAPGSNFTVYHSTGTINAIWLKTQANTTVTANQSLTLEHRGDQWYQI